MNNYYIEKDGKIIFFDTDLQRLQDTIIGQDLQIKETERPIINFEFADTDEYIAEQKAIAKQSVVKEYADIFKEFDRICGAKFSRGLCTTSQITAQRDILDDELTQKLEEIENG